MIHRHIKQIRFINFIVQTTSPMSLLFQPADHHISPDNIKGIAGMNITNKAIGTVSVSFKPSFAFLSCFRY